MKGRERRNPDLREKPLRRRKRKIAWTTAGLVGAGALAFFIQKPLILKLYEKNGEILMARYHFSEEDFNHSRLRKLRERERLDAVTAPGKSQFDKIVLLRHWTRRQWETKMPFYYPPWDALEILDLARSGASRGFCAQYAIVFLQACQSLGIHARYVDLPGHFVAAAWSDDYNRWVVMDPMNDWYFEKDGIPLRTRDLCDAYWKHDERRMVRVMFDGSRTPVTRSDLAQYRMFSIAKVADQLKYPVPVIVNGVPRTLRHDPDYHHYPLVGRDKTGITSAFLAWKAPGATENFTDRPVSDDADDFRYRMNQTLIVLARREPAKSAVKLTVTAENAPTLD